MEDNDYDQIIDGGAEYSAKSDFSKPKIVFTANEICIQLRSKEMKRGYFNTTISKDGLPIRTWVEDTRKAYCSSIIALSSLLTPEILEDDSFSEQEKKFKDNPKNKDKVYKNPIDKVEEDIDKCFKKYAYYVLEPKNINGNINYIKTDKYFMPEVDEVVSIRKVFPDFSEELIESPGCWNKYINAYWNEMVIHQDKLFKELMRIIHRKNYFKNKGGFGNWTK